LEHLIIKDRFMKQLHSRLMPFFFGSLKSMVLLAESSEGRGIEASRSPAFGDGMSPHGKPS
jgi:hypothetical protein